MAQEHELLATPENVFWGHFDATRRPVLEVDSGDTVYMHTLPACLEEELPKDSSRITPDHAAAIEHHRSDRGTGPHFMTGPVYVRGARPGHVLQVDILTTEVRQDWGFASILPLLGALPDEFTDYETIHIDIDQTGKQAVLPWGTVLDLDPFFGIMAVAPPRAWGRIGSPEPRAHGGNIDNKDLRPGTTLYLPVFEEGALFSAGDGHGRQGHGEVCITALETALNGRFRLTVRDDMSLSQPFAESDQWLMSMGFNVDLDDAAATAIREMIPRVAETGNLSRNHAYMLLSLVADLHVTQVVDGNKGVHMIMPKNCL